MDRRSFFRTMIGGVAATAAVRTWPFRVFSFPTEVVVPDFSLPIDKFATIYYSKEALDALAKNLKFFSIRPSNGHYYAVIHPLRLAQYNFRSASGALRRLKEASWQ